MTGFTGTVTAGTSRWIWLGKIRNGYYSSYTPKLYMRTKDAQGTVLEELYYEFPSPLGELPAGSPSTTDPDIVTSTDAMDGTNV